MNSEDGDLSDVITNIDAVFQNYGIVVVVLAGIAGVVLAGYAAMKLHSILNEHHSMAQNNAQTGVGGCVLGIVIGGLMTISSVIVTWFGLLYG